MKSVRFQGTFGAGVFTKQIDVNLDDYFVIVDGKKISLGDIIRKVLGSKP